VVLQLFPNQIQIHPIMMITGSRALTLSLLLLSKRSSRAFLLASFVNRAAIQRMAEIETIELTPRDYGYRVDPISWSELVDIVEKENNLAKLSRNVQQQKEYMIYRRELLKEWNSVYDHILVSKFDFERQLIETDRPDNDRNDRVWAAYPPLDDVREIKKVLKPNDFPYYFSDGMEHWCLWKLCEDVTDNDIEEAKKDLQSTYGDIVTYVSWRNPPHLKSLPDIDHIHIVCLRESNCQT
jgi:hypothetical protein